MAKEYLLGVIKLTLLVLCLSTPVARFFTINDHCSSMFLPTDNCSTSTTCSFNQSKGCFLITEENYVATYTISLQNETSLIFLKMEQANQTDTRQGNVMIILSEADHSTDIWKFEKKKLIADHTHISQSSNLTINMRCEGKWTDLIFSYEELPFEYSNTTSTEDEGSLNSTLLDGKFYRPNALVLLHLTPSKSWNESSVMVIVQFLDVDEISGDYLLIGAGKKPFSGPRAAFLTGKVKTPKKYYVASDDVYIMFYSQASNAKKKGFELKWERNGNRITKPEVDPQDKPVPDKILQSVAICFYNSSWIQEFKKTEYKGQPFPQFREKFADIANRYAKDKEISLLSEISADLVELFRVSSVIPPNDDDDTLSNGVLYVMVTIVQSYDRRQAVFRAHQMEEIRDLYDEYDVQSKHTLLGIKVGKCPEDLDFTSWFAATGICFVSSVILFVIIWIWRYNVFWKTRSIKEAAESKDNQKLVFEDKQKKIAENEYISYENKSFTMPKLRITTDEGHSFSLEDDDTENPYTTVSSEDSDTDEIFNKDWILKKRKSRGELPVFTRTNKNESNTMRFSVPISAKKEGRVWTESKLAEAYRNISGTGEHLYDLPTLEYIITDDADHTETRL